MKIGLIGLFVSSGMVSCCFQLFAYVVRRETEYDLSSSWLGSYLGATAVILFLATMKVIVSDRD